MCSAVVFIYPAQDIPLNTEDLFTVRSETTSLSCAAL